MTTEDTIKQMINDNPIILFMKGTPEEPRCGFSAKAVAALRGIEANFAYVDVLTAPRVREGLPKVSEFPTFPQLFISGELVGGSDIVSTLAASGELQTMTKGALGASA